MAPPAAWRASSWEGLSSAPGCTRGRAKLCYHDLWPETVIPPIGILCNEAAQIRLPCCFLSVTDGAGCFLPRVPSGQPAKEPGLHGGEIAAAPYAAIQRHPSVPAGQAESQQWPWPRWGLERKGRGRARPYGKPNAGKPDASLRSAPRRPRLCLPACPT